MAEEMGDRRWRELMARHHEIFRRTLREHQGKELDTAGDGVFARFDSPASAVRWACAVTDSVRELGVEIRVGIHIGEAEVLHGKLSGLNVHAAARTMAEAGAGEILVTGSVRDIVRGSGFGFADRGVHELRGIEGDWHLFEVISVDGTPRSQLPSEEDARARRDAIVPPPLVKRRGTRRIGIAAATALLVAGGALGLAFTVGGNSSSGPLAGCEVTPFGPLNDRGFNQAVYDGLTHAATTWGISVRDRVTDPPSEKLAVQNIRHFIDQKCGLIVTVGGFMGDVTAGAAKRNPTLKFLTTDDIAVRRLDNLANVTFAVDQAAFKAGYVAAGVSKTGKVATFGGVPIGTVTPFMKGFAAGVLYYNKKHGTNVQVLGWNARTGKGTFVSDDPKNGGAFGDQPAATRIASDFIRQGADVIMPVDGATGETAGGKAARQAKGVLLIGVDTDQHFATPDYVDLWLTSVLKNYKRMVYLAMGKVVHGEFESGVLAGTLANGGVRLAPYYGLSARVPGPLQAELQELEKGISDGSISVDPKSYI
jgi:basic membrane protein A